MRLLIAALALAGALFHVVPAKAQIVDERYPVATISAGDVVKAKRCAPSFGCRRQRATYSSGTILGSRPSGCPSRFCGCAASLHLFGKIIPALNLAANWLRFPRAAPAPNMAAARPGHVFVLKQHIAGNTWLVFDPNSGHGRTRLHARSIAGFTIVNPHT